MASQDASNESESREQVVDAHSRRLSLVSLPRLDPMATMLIEILLQPTRRGANTTRSTGLCSQHNVFCNIPLAARRSNQRREIPELDWHLSDELVRISTQAGILRLMRFLVRSLCQWKRLTGM